MTAQPPCARAPRRAPALALAALLVAAPCAAERFVQLGTQPDGSEVFVQAAPPTLRTDGRYQGWFRTVPKVAKPVTDEFGFERAWTDFLALNVADCATRRMAAIALHYRDANGVVVARFEPSPRDVELREVRRGTLGENMLGWLCSPPPRSAPAPSAAGGSPF